MYGDITGPPTIAIAIGVVVGVLVVAIVAVAVVLVRRRRGLIAGLRKKINARHSTSKAHMQSRVAHLLASRANNPLFQSTPAPSSVEMADRTDHTSRTLWTPASARASMSQVPYLSHFMFTFSNRIEMRLKLFLKLGRVGLPVFFATTLVL